MGLSTATRRRACAALLVLAGCRRACSGDPPRPVISADPPARDAAAPAASAAPSASPPEARLDLARTTDTVLFFPADPSGEGDVIVRVAEDATVDDLDVVIERATSVRVLRDDFLVREAKLDAAKSGAQPLGVRGAGGEWRLAPRGPSKSRIVDVRVWGRAPSARAHEPVVRRGFTPAAALPSRALDVPAGAAVPAGCFGWSRSKAAPLCTVGSWGMNGPFDRTWWVVAIEPDGAHDVVRLEPPDGSFDDPTTAPLRDADRATLLAYVQKNDVVPLAPLATTPPELKVTSRETTAAGDNQAARSTHKATLALRPGAPLELDVITDSPVAAPALTGYAIPGTRVLVLDRSASYADEGEYGTDLTAWRCDRDAAQCTSAR